LVLADVETSLRVRGLAVDWLATRARLFELANVSHRPGPMLQWLAQRLGWGVLLPAEVRTDAASLGIRLDGYLLWLDGTRSPWLSGLRLGVEPGGRVGEGRQALDIAAVGELFAQRRLRATGSLRGFAAWRVSTRDSVERAGISIDLPWGERESWRTRVEGSVERSGGEWVRNWAVMLGW